MSWYTNTGYRSFWRKEKRVFVHNEGDICMDRASDTLRTFTNLDNAGYHFLSISFWRNIARAVLRGTEHSTGETDVALPQARFMFPRCSVVVVRSASRGKILGYFHCLVHPYDYMSPGEPRVSGVLFLRKQMPGPVPAQAAVGTRIRSPKSGYFHRSPAASHARPCHDPWITKRKRTWHVDLPEVPGPHARTASTRGLQRRTDSLGTYTGCSL
jgi:hypothetical protein